MDIKSNKPMIDVIVPFGACENQPERSDNLQTVIHDYLLNQDYPNYRIILAEMSNFPSQEQFASRYCQEYIFIDLANGIFSPDAIQNIGFLQRRNPNKHVYFHQADFIIPSDNLSSAMEIMNKTSAPFVYPFWGEIHLSRPVSEAVRTKDLNGNLLYKFFRELIKDRTLKESYMKIAENIEGHRELKIPEKYIETLNSLLPDQIKLDKLSTFSDLDLWGNDDREYAPYQWSENSVRTDVFCKISGGPRASASYLCTDEAFRKLGGIPVLEGWGYGDLMGWLNVQTVFEYSTDDNNIFYKDQKVTSNRPHVHLWHPIGQRPDYYKNTASNEEHYNNHLKLSKEARLKTIIPLPNID